MSTLSFTVTGLDALTNISTALARGSANPDIATGMQDAAYVYMAAMRQRFNSNGDGTWAPLAARTIYLRSQKLVGKEKWAKVKGSTQIRLAIAAGIRTLYDTGQLYNSLVPGEPGFFEEMDGNTITVGTSDRTARWHQDGTPKMPARPILVQPKSETLTAMSNALAAGLATMIDSQAGA